MGCSCEATQAAVTGAFGDPFPVPPYPPASWYSDRPDWLTPETKLTIGDDGRVAGYFFHHGQCLVHDATACPRPSPTYYAAFHQQDVACDDGSVVRCGVIGNTNGHADPRASVSVAMAHYADPDRQIISCRAYDDEHGGFILGSLIPRATFGDVAMLRASALSGDWRPMPPQWWDAHGIQAATVNECEGYDCIGPTLVTRPGLPLVRKFARAAVLGGAGGVQLEQEPRMASTTIDLGNGMTITTNAPDEIVAPPGPHAVPDEAMVAAPPPPPPSTKGPPTAPAKPSTDAQTSGSDMENRVSTLEDQVKQLQQVVSQLVDHISSSRAAAATPLPEVEADPKAA